MGNKIRKVADRANYDLAGITATKDAAKLTAATALAIVISNAKSLP